jgi:hypothetical protein
MDEVVTDQIEEVETEVVDTPDEEVNRIDALSDEDFEKEFNEVETDESDTVKSDDEPKDLEAIYKSNLGTDAKLDDPIVVKVDGTVYELDSLDEIRNLIERGTGVTRKYQKLAADRKALEEQLAALGQEPNVTSDNPVEDDVETIANDILASSYADAFTADVQQLDAQTKEVLASDPQMLKGLAIDYESGFAQKIMPNVHKYMKINGMSFEDAYFEAGKSYQSDTEKKTNNAAKAKMLNAQPKTVSKASSNELGRKSIDAMSDAEFNAYFANL